MNRPELTHCDHVRERIEMYLDGELGDAERAAFESHMFACADCAAELALARRVSRGLTLLEIEKCPTVVTDAVFAHARMHPLPAQRPWWRLTWRPALIGAMALVLLAATHYVGQNNKVASPQFTRAELEQAQKQAKWTLVFIGQLSRKSATKAARDVMGDRVGGILRRAIDPNAETTPKENEHAS